jgi:hypothetical protein
MGLLIQPANYPLLINTRAYIPGRLDSRAGIVVVNSNSMGGLVHSLKRLNDPLPGISADYAIIAGTGSSLWIGIVSVLPSVFNQIDTGYSGAPLGFVTYRPPNSPESWLYISDSLQMRKARTDGLVYPQGIAPPLAAPTVDFGEPLLTVIDDFNEAIVGSWIVTGTAGALSANPAARVNDTLELPFNTGPGWCEFLELPRAVLKTNYGRGMRLVLDAGTPANADVVVVSCIYPASLHSSIAAIYYDSGATGECCLVPTSPSSLVNNLTLRGALSKLARTWNPPFTSGANLQVQPNTVLSVGNTPNVEDILVQSSTPGPLGTFSVRTSTINAHAVGEPVRAVSSFRAFCAATHGSSVSSEAGYFRTTIAAGTGTIDNPALPVDLSVIGSRPTQPSDELHLSLRVDVPANLTEGRIVLDVDSGTNDFAHNYYYASFRASDLALAAAGSSTTQAAIASSISNAQIDQYNSLNPGGYAQQIINSQSLTESTTLGAASTQAGTGTSQWTELFIPLSNLIRVGTDTSRTLANVLAVRLYFVVTGSTVVDVHGLYLKGSYGPDVGTVGNDYYYRFRRRSSLTGAKSNPSPYIRSGMRPHNQRLAITLPGDTTEGDQLDVFRWGGAVTGASATGDVPWFYVGSASNPGVGTPAPYDAIFNDDFADSDILNAEVLEFDNQQPYSTIDTPKSGTCKVIGTSAVWQSGDLFNPRWAPGSIIEINGVPYTLYAQPHSSTFLEIVESATTEGPSAPITSTVRPTTWDHSYYSTFTNPPLAYDGNTATRSVASVLSPFNGELILKGFPDLSPVYTSIKLSVLSYYEHLDNINFNEAFVRYSTDGGATYSDLWSVVNTDHGMVSAPVLNEISLPSGTVLSDIHILCFVSTLSTTGKSTMGVNEVYLTVTYAPTGTLLVAPFILRQPTLMAEPMYAQWGPFLGYLMAVGDPYQPGVLHATKPNQPDEGSDLLDVEVTPPSEALLNGCMYGNGASFVWSTQRMFQLASSSDLGLQFTPTGGASPSVPFVPQEVPGAPGLFAPWWFCVYDKIYYGTASGIVATTGGTPQSITDPHLSLLFPHDGQNGVPVTVGSDTFQPPDMTQTQALRLYPEKGHIKFAYLDVNGKNQIIVYSIILGVWSQDDYVTDLTDPQIVSCYSEEGQSVNRNLLGGNNYVYQEQGDLEAGLVAGWQVRMAQSSDFPMGFLAARDGYLGLMSANNVNLEVVVDSGAYNHVVPSTGGAYGKVYVPLQPIKGKAWEWAVTSPGAVRLFLRDCWFNLKTWNGQKFEPFQPFRDLSRELKP